MKRLYNSRNSGHKTFIHLAHDLRSHTLTSSFYQSHPAFLAGYRNKATTKMKAGIILLCTKDNLFQEFKIEGAELEMYQNLFMGRVKKFYEMNNIS